MVWVPDLAWRRGINNITIALFGFDNIWLWFFVFQIIQILLSIKGFQGAKWIGNIGGVVISIAMLYLLYLCVTQYGTVVSENLMQNPAPGYAVCSGNHRLLRKQYDGYAQCR